MNELSTPDVASLIAKAHLLVLIALLCLAAIIDVRTYRLPNWLTLGGTAVALVFSMLTSVPAIPSFGNAAAGAGIGLAMLLPLYMLRVSGAGDVKLMAMVGAFLGAPQILFAVLFTLAAGGVAAIALALWRRSGARLAHNVREMAQMAMLATSHGMRPEFPAMQSVGRLPYGVCVAAGTFAWLALVHFR